MVSRQKDEGRPKIAVAWSSMLHGSILSHSTTSQHASLRRTELRDGLAPRDGVGVSRGSRPWSRFSGISRELRLGITVWCEMLYLVGSKKEVRSRKKRRFASTHSSGSIVGGSNGTKFAFNGQMIWEDARSRDKQAKAKAKEELEAA